MKKLRVHLLLTIFAFCTLTAILPLTIHADSVTMTFTGVGPQDNNSGGVYTYPYDFTVTPTGGGASQNLQLMCISFDKEIYLQSPNEYWLANVVTAGSLGATYEEEAYLYSQAVAHVASNTISGAANWADWALGESATLSGQESFLSSHISGTELADAESYLTGLSSLNLADFSNYLVYEAQPDSEHPLSDGIPQNFVGGPSPVPESGSLLLLATGLLGLAGLTFRRKSVLKQASQSSLG